MDSLIPKRKSTPVLANSVIYNFSHDSTPFDSLQKVLGNIKSRTNAASRSSSINKLRYTPTKLLMVGQEVQGKTTAPGPAKKKPEKTLLQKRPTLQNNTNSNKTPQPTEYLPTSPTSRIKEYSSSPAKQVPSQESSSKKPKDISTFTSAARKLSKQKSSSKNDLQTVKSLNLEEEYAASVLYKSISQLSQKINLEKSKQSKSQKKIEPSPAAPNVTKHINIVPNLETIQIEFNTHLPNILLSDKEKMSYVQKRINEVTRMRRKVLDGEIGSFTNQNALKAQSKPFSKSLEARRESNFIDPFLNKSKIQMDHHQGSSFQPEKRLELPRIPILTEQTSNRILPRSHHQRAESIPLSVRNFSLFEERERFGNFDILSKEKFSFKKLRSFTNHRLTFENVPNKRFETSQEKNFSPIPNPYTRSLERSVREFLVQKNKQKLLNFKHPRTNKRGINDLHDLFQLPKDDSLTKPFLTHRPTSFNNLQNPPPPNFKRFSEFEPELKDEIIKKTCTTAHDLSSEIIFEEDTSRSEIKGWL